MWFEGITTQEVAQKRYKQLARVFHPDVPGGDTRTMQEIHREYSALLGRLSQPERIQQQQPPRHHHAPPPPANVVIITNHAAPPRATITPQTVLEWVGVGERILRAFGSVAQPWDDEEDEVS